MGYSIDPISANCYPDTTVLINKFDIRDEVKLNEVESVLASVRYAEWLNAPKADSCIIARLLAPLQARSLLLRDQGWG